jgi:hypothetical protein
MVFTCCVIWILKSRIFADMSKVHIGHKIKEVLKKSPYGHSEFAAMINMSRDGVYKIFEKESVATDLLQKISQVLEHDFFAYYQRDLNLVNENKPKYGYAAQEDLEEIARLVHSLARQVGQIQDDIAHLVQNKKGTGQPKKLKPATPPRKKAAKQIRQPR